MRRLAFASILALTLAAPALASDGVLEINQTCAVLTGCFAGDTPGFPVTITGSDGGNYRLTSDLALPDENTTGIEVAASSVTIDLGGFALIGVVSCSGFAGSIVCTPAAGTGDGIGRSGASVRFTIVRDGVVRGMGRHGISLGRNSRVDRVRAYSNGGSGILMQDLGVIADSEAFFNGGNGIAVGGMASVRSVTVEGNGLRGLSAGGSGVVSGVVSVSNGGEGISCASRCSLSEAVSRLNEKDGVLVGGASVVANVAVHENDSRGLAAGQGSVLHAVAASSNGSGGIEVFDASVVSTVASTQNTGSGITAADSAAVQDSTSRLNTEGEGLSLGASTTYQGVTTGTVTGGIDMGGNSCNGTASCP